MLQRYRVAMVRAERGQLSGNVEVDKLWLEVLKKVENVAVAPANALL